MRRINTGNRPWLNMRTVRNRRKFHQVHRLTAAVRFAGYRRVSVTLRDTAQAPVQVPMASRMAARMLPGRLKSVLCQEPRLTRVLRLLQTVEFITEFKNFGIIKIGTANYVFVHWTFGIFSFLISRTRKWKRKGKITYTHIHDTHYIYTYTIYMIFIILWFYNENLRPNDS